MHDTKVYRAYQRAEERLRGQGGQVRRVVLDYALKCEYGTGIRTPVPWLRKTLGVK
jgi:hypothetical protein